MKYKICVENNELISIEETLEKADLIIDIRELSQLVYGFRNIDELIFADKIEYVNDNAILFFKHKNTTMIYEFF